MIVRIQQEKSLFANSNEVRRTLIISVTGSLVLSLIMLFPGEPCDYKPNPQINGRNKEGQFKSKTIFEKNRFRKLMN